MYKYNVKAEYFLLLREAVRLLPHHHKNIPTIKMRQLSLYIAETDKNFEALRIKIHVKPEAKDAAHVRAYAGSKGLAMLQDEYELLENTITRVFHPQDLTQQLLALAGQVNSPKLSDEIKKEESPRYRHPLPYFRG